MITFVVPSFSDLKHEKRAVLSWPVRGKERAAVQVGVVLEMRRVSRMIL